MKYYYVVKLDTKTDEEIDYGQMCEDDMMLVTRGYKPDTEMKSIYDRRGSRYFFIVDEINPT